MLSLILHYGPYEANGIIKHKIRRLRGLIEYLTNKKFRVELKPSPHLNRLTVEMKGRTIFTCDIRNLLFNMSLELDVVGKRIVEAIEYYYSIFFTTENVGKFVSVSKGMRWLNHEYDEKNLQQYLDSDISLLYQLGDPHTMPAITDPRFQALFLAQMCGEDDEQKERPMMLPLSSSRFQPLKIGSSVINRLCMARDEDDFEISYISEEPTLTTECKDGPCHTCPSPRVLTTLLEMPEDECLQ